MPQLHTMTVFYSALSIWVAVYTFHSSLHAS